MDAAPGPAPQVALSIVVDAHPRFQYQAMVWLASVTRLASRQPRDLFVHCLPGVGEAFKRRVETLGAHVIDIEPFETGHVYCNKIQAVSPERFAAYDYVVFNDCDIAWTGWLDFTLEDPFYGRVVDLPNPPLDTLTRLFEAADVTPPPIVPTGVPGAAQSEPRTFASNCNGGFYVVRWDLLGPLAERWRARAHWCFDRKDQLGTYGAHVDQVAMALALAELRAGIGALEAGFNFPVHLPATVLPPIPAPPRVVHYHDRLDKEGRIIPTGVEQVDQAIAAVNALIDARKREDFDNETFWNFRYRLFPQIGSGLGSRDEPLALKRRTLAPFARLTRSAVDLGCGDLEVNQVLPFSGYVGLDVSEEALRIARARRPDWRFASLAGDSVKERGELSLCLDVLIHQSSKHRYEAVLEGAVRAGSELCIISGYDAPPPGMAGMVFFHEPLSVTLNARSDLGRIELLATYRDTALYGVVKKGGLFDCSGVTLSDLVRLHDESPIPDAWARICRAALEYADLVDASPALWPGCAWIAGALPLDMTDRTVLEAGGAWPLLAVLAGRGARCATLCEPGGRPPGPIARGMRWPAVDSDGRANAVGRAALSRITAVTEANIQEPVDVICAMGGVDGLPAPGRLQTFERFRALLEEDGRLLLTVGLEPGSQRLRRVGRTASRATAATVRAELTLCGFRVDGCDVQRAGADFASISARPRR
jgi:hypothetical protein